MQGKLPKDNNWIITLDGFQVGVSPTAHLDTLTEIGNGGHYSRATNVDVTVPRVLTQGPSFALLTGGNIAETIRDILNIPPVSNKTYAIADTKLYEVTPTTLTEINTIAGSSQGEKVVHFQGAVYYFYNTSSAGDVGKYDMVSTFDDDWGSTTPYGFSALQKAKHPVAIKEDIMIFGNGRYLGTFFNDSNAFTVDHLDFGVGAEVADVAFHSNQWLIAVNYGIQTTGNSSSANLYLWEAGAINNILEDEITLGIQEIGFIKVKNGIIYLCYKDLTGQNVFGYVSGRTITPLGYFTGSLPSHNQKTDYKGYIKFLSDSKTYLAGSATPDFPFSISQYSSVTGTTSGTVAVPFGTPLVSSNTGLYKQTGYSTASTWQSITFPTAAINASGYIDKIMVLTNSLGTNAKCKIVLYGNQETENSTDLIIQGIGKQRHSFADSKITLKKIDDFSLKIDWSNGSATNPCKIRKIIIQGHWINRS